MRSATRAQRKAEETRLLLSLNPVSDEPAFCFDDFRLNRRDGLFRRAESGQEQPVTLGSRALDVLMALVERHGTLVTKQVLMDAAWAGMAVEDSNLAVQISSLRRVLDEGRTGGSCIQTVIGRGYRFLPSVAAEQPPGAQTTAVDSRPPDKTNAERSFSSTARPHRPSPVVVALAAALISIGVGSGALMAWEMWFWRGHTPVSAPPSLSLVVLPFDNLGGEPDDDYLVAGVTDDLTTALSHIPGTFVISRATAYSYRGKAEDIRRIGRDLGVRYVVRGSLRRFGPTLRVNVELSSTDTGAQLWSDSFDQKVADLASCQEQIVVRMRAALHVSLIDTEAARSLQERPTNPDAFDFILRARAVMLLPQTRDTMAQAVELFQQALSRDPNAVLALVGALVATLNEQYFGSLSQEVAMDSAEQYLRRAKMLAPNSEAVLAAEAMVVEYRGLGLDYRRVRPEQKVVSQRLLDLYPNNPEGYFRLGVLARNEGRLDEAAEYFARTIRLNPRSSVSKAYYWNMAYSLITAGHDREGLEWADRTMAAPGSLPSLREKLLLGRRAVAYFRIGDVETAKRLAAELNARFPFETWRARYPDDPDSETERNRYRSIQEALKAAGSRDHLDPNADFGVAPDNVLHENSEGETPTTAPGVTTVNTEQLASMLKTQTPLVIDTMDGSWHRSVPGAVGLDFNGMTHGTFTDAVQQRLEQKLRALTGGDMAKPIVAMSFNVARFDGYNLALRLRHAGYTNVYWYRGGREAWEVAGMPEDAVRPADW